MTRTLWDTLTAFGQWDFSDSLQLRSRIITFSRAIAFSHRARVPVDNIQIIRSRMGALSGPNSDESDLVFCESHPELIQLVLTVSTLDN